MSPQIATPAAPLSGYSKVYVKATGLPYVQNSSGLEYPAATTYPLTSQTTSYGALGSDGVILASAASANVTVTLPTAVGATGQAYTIRKTDSTTNTVTVATTSAQTIDGQTTYVLTTQFAYVQVVSDGANWQIVNQSRLLSKLATGSIASTVTETVIGTFSLIPANDPIVGSTFHVSARGTADFTTSPTVTIRVKLDSTSGQRQFDSGALTCNGTATNKAWALEARFMITATGAGGTYESFGWYNDSLRTANTQIGSNFTAQTIDTTSAHTVVVTAQWGTASASNVCRSLAGTLERVCH